MVMSGDTVVLVQLTSALDILNYFCPPGHTEEECVELCQGYSSRFAWNLHQSLKRDIVAQIPHEGGTVQAEIIRQWLSHFDSLI